MITAIQQFNGSIVPGDLMLYSGNCLVLFYCAAGGYSYTRVGKIADTTGHTNDHE